MRIVLIAAQSTDGFITRHQVPGTAWVSEADQQWFRRALAPFDATIMGSITYESAKTEITARLTANRQRVVMTRNPDAFAMEAHPGRLEFSAQSPAEIVRDLQTKGCQACALLGGGQIHELFLTTRLVDEIWLTIEPRLFGHGTPLVDGKIDVSLQLDDVSRLDGSDSILAKYRVLK